MHHLQHFFPIILPFSLNRLLITKYQTQLLFQVKYLEGKISLGKQGPDSNLGVVILIQTPRYSMPGLQPSNSYVHYNLGAFSEVEYRFSSGTAQDNQLHCFNSQLSLQRVNQHASEQYIQTMINHNLGLEIQEKQVQEVQDGSNKQQEQDYSFQYSLTETSEVELNIYRIFQQKRKTKVRITLKEGDVNSQVGYSISKKHSNRLGG